MKKLAMRLASIRTRTPTRAPIIQRVNFGVTRMAPVL